MEVKAICDRGDNEAAPKTDTQTLLWVLGDGPSGPSTRRARKKPGIHASWTARHSSAEPIPPHLWSHHGGYVTPPSAHRGGPPSREVCHERVRKSIVRAKSRCRTPVIAWAQKQLKQEEEWIRSKLLEEMDEEGCIDIDLMGGRCSLLGRSRGFRCVDHGADRYETLADKALSLQLGGVETRQRLDQRKRELKEKQVMARMNESKKEAVKDVESVANRRRAADILSELHKRTLFAELASKRESQEHEAQQAASAAVGHVVQEEKTTVMEEESEVQPEQSRGSKPRHTRVTLALNSPPKQNLSTEVVRVTVHSARALRAADVNGLADPFCVVELLGKPGTKCHTQVVRRSLNPEWDESFVPKNLTENDSMQFSVFDYDFDKHDCLGTATVKGSRIIESGVIEEELTLEDANHRQLGRRTKINGYLSVTMAILNSDGVTVRRADSFTRQLRMSFGGRMAKVREAISERDEVARVPSYIRLGAVSE